MSEVCEWCGVAIVQRFDMWCRAKGGEGEQACDVGEDGFHDPAAPLTARRLHDHVFTFPALVTGAHDGDTIYAVIDQGFGFRNHGTKKTIDGVTLRLLGISCLELGMPGGIETRDYVRGLVVGQDVVLKTVKDDKYGGRYDAVVQMHNGEDLATHLVRNGWAVWWDGTGTAPYPTWPRV